MIMAVLKQSMPSFASIISVLSILFYSGGFLRIELELHQHKERINALKSMAEAKPPSDEPDPIKNAPGRFVKHCELEFTSYSASVCVCVVISVRKYHYQSTI